MKIFPRQKFTILLLCEDGEWHRGSEEFIADTPKGHLGSRGTRTARGMVDEAWLALDYFGSRKKAHYRITDAGRRELVRLRLRAERLGIAESYSFTDVPTKKKATALVQRSREIAKDKNTEQLEEEWEGLS